MGVQMVVVVVVGKVVEGIVVVAGMVVEMVVGRPKMG